jgi:hypothetical protein
MKMSRTLISFLIIFCLVCGCDYEAVQYIIGEMNSEPAPMAGKTIALVSGERYKTCQGTRVETIVDNAGQFSFSRMILRSNLDPYVQMDALCVYEENRWSPIWHSIYGPPPETMEFKCIRTESIGWKCTMNDFPSDDEDAV